MKDRKNPGKDIKHKYPLIILAGPTAVGKTDLSIALAKRIHGQIISADSMQVYRGMDIGTAKITREEMQGIPHYLIDVLDPTEDFNVVTFQRMAKDALQTIYASGDIPILVGGTGFYIQALLYDIDFAEQDGDTAIREKYQRMVKEQGADYLHEQLRLVDPPAADEIHAHNVKRVIRALEFYEQTGRRISEHNEEQQDKESPYNYYYFVIHDDRQRLYDRIDRRVERMLESGLIDEVQRLRDSGCTREMVSMQGLGYKEVFAYLEGECSYDEMVYILKRDTRHFAKRQLTWFRREREVIWMDWQAYPDQERMLDNIMKRIDIENMDSGFQEWN